LCDGIIMRQSYRLIWNSIVIWIMRVLRVFPELIVIPFIIHRLGESLYGIYVLGWSLIPVLDLLRVGVSSGLVKYSAEYFEHNDIDSINKTLSTACIMTATLGLIVGVAILLAVNVFGGWLVAVSPEHSHLLKFTCNAVAIMIMATFPFMPYSGILHARQRYDLFNFVNTVFVYLRVGVIVGWFVFVGPSFEVLMIASALYFFASNFVHVILAKRLVPGLKSRLILSDIDTAKLLTGFGSVVVLYSICVVINVSGIRWIIGTMISPAFVGVFALIYKPAALMQQLIQAMSLSIFPATSRYEARRDVRMLKELLRRSTRYITIFGILGMVEVIFLIRPVLGLWLGENYEYLAPYAIVMCGGMTLWMSTSAAGHMLRGMAMLKESFVSMLVGPVILTVTIIFVSISLGWNNYWQIILAYSLGYLISIGMRIFFCSRKLNLAIAGFLWHAYGEALTIGLPLGGVIYILTVKYQINGILARQLIAIGTIAMFGVLFASLFMTSVEKELVKNIKGSLLSRLSRRNREVS